MQWMVLTTLISTSSSLIQPTNLLCRWLMTSWVLGKSSDVDFGRIATKQFRNVVLFVTASDWWSIKAYSRCDSTGKSYLVIDGDKLSNHMKQILASEHLWSHQLHYRWVQRSLSRYLLVSSCFHPIPNWTRDRPVLLRYVRFLTSHLVEYIMLTDVRVTGWVAACVKCFSLPFLLDELYVVPLVFVSSLPSLINRSLTCMAYTTVPLVTKTPHFYARNWLRHYRWIWGEGPSPCLSLLKLRGGLLYGVISRARHPIIPAC